MELQPFIERMLEVENLTDNLEDSQAKRLLDWGIARLPVILDGLTDPINAAEKTGELMRIMRSINRLIPDRQSLTPDDLADLAEKAGAIFRSSLPNADLAASAAALAGMNANEALDYLIKFVTHENPTPTPQLAPTPPVDIPQEPKAEKKLSIFERLFGKRP